MRILSPHLILLILLFATPLGAQIVNIEEQRITGTNDSLHWYGHLRGGVSLVRVRQQSLQLLGESRVQYKNGNHLALILLNVNLLRAGGNDFSKQAFGHLRYNYDLSNTWTWEAYAQIQTSPLQLLRQRLLTGTGPRWRAMVSGDGRQRLYLGASWLWEHNVFTEPYKDQNWNRFSSYVSVTLRAGNHTTLTGTTYWQPVWGLIKNYRVSTDWLLKVAITSRIALTVDFTYNLDKNLPPEAPEATYAWRNGITWRLL
ncbi:MAG: DUF481 domain-containing protein [Saprospiraceae bacterium]|nr:DUF481 domain-containing protein [Saprospiraceae bacterium]